ncbi:MAG: DUF2029 domain-containing protein, partial [Oxalobacteraceae bacterium]
MQASLSGLLVVAMRSISRERIAVYGASTILAIVWTLFAGKDIPWDALHYHLYAGYSIFHNRLAIDYFPASPQTYFSPYAHAPLFLMVSAGWPPMMIGAAFACLQAVALWLTFEVARAVSRDARGQSPRMVTWGAVALAFANPVFLQALGSSFVDITTGTLALAGYAALVNAYHGMRNERVSMAGVLLGMAAALKMSNAIFSLAPALLLVMGSAHNWRERVRGLLLFAAFAALALALISGSWAWDLWKAFKNPFFPMMEGLFNPTVAVGVSSAGLPPASSTLQNLLGAIDSVRDPRFLPSSITEALTRPFDLLAAKRSLHTETMAADARYA